MPLAEEFFKRVVSDTDVLYREVGEPSVLDLLQEIHGGSQIDAQERWEVLCLDLRRPVLFHGCVLEWNYFKRVLRVTRLPSMAELEEIGALYARDTPDQLANRIRGLTGRQFECFVGELLTRNPKFRSVLVTPATRDEGVDIRASYLPDPFAPSWALLGQAKNTASPTAVGEARDFVGALDTANERKVMGLFISTGGFTDPARSVLVEKSRYQIIAWGMKDILEHLMALAVGVRTVSISAAVADETFWDELLDKS